MTLGSFCFLCYLIGLFLPCGILMFSLKVREWQKIRVPVKEQMLRAPGASLAKKVDDLSSTLLERTFGFGVIPVVFTLIIFLPKDVRLSTEQAAAGIGTTLAFALGITIFILRTAKKLRNHRLGLQGERFVAEHLQELSRAGCYVFHDLQPEQTWNIDHIVVTPESVLVIETKTRRKRGNENAHKAVFDGREIHFPWGRDRHGLEQAERNAAWVRDYLSKALAAPVKVEAVLTLPGWLIHRKGRGTVFVVNPKEIRALVRARGGQTITADEEKQMKQIAHALGEKCRDVEF